MRTTKLIAAGAGLLALGALVGHAMAQMGPGGRTGQVMSQGMGPGMGMGHGTMMQGQGKLGRGGMMGNLGDPAQRLDALKTQIGIKPEQAAAWDAYAKTFTEFASEMQSRRTSVDHNALAQMEPKDRQDFVASMQKAHDESYWKVKAAAEALLPKLDAAQQSKAKTALPGLVAVGPAGKGMGMGAPGPMEGMMMHGMMGQSSPPTSGQQGAHQH